MVACCFVDLSYQIFLCMRNACVNNQGLIPHKKDSFLCEKWLLLSFIQMNEQDKALPDPSVWRVVKAAAPEWYIILIGVIASAADGITFPVISVFMGELFEVCKNSRALYHIIA